VTGSEALTSADLTVVILARASQGRKTRRGELRGSTLDVRADRRVDARNSAPGLAAQSASPKHDSLKRRATGRGAARSGIVDSLTENPPPTVRFLYTAEARFSLKETRGL